MTKIEVVESLVRCIYGGTTEDFLTKNKVFLYDGIVIVEGLIEGKNKGYQQFCKYNKEGKFWTIEDLNNPKELAPLASEEHQHQKHLMEKEAQTKKEESEMKAKAQFKELERKEERFEEIEAKYLEGIKDVGYHLLWLKDMKQKNPNWYKDHVRREHMELNFGVSRVKKEHKGDPDKFGKIGDVVSLPNDDSLTPKEIQDFVEHQEQKYLMEKEAEKQKDLYLKRLAAAECHPNQLTAQDLIQAAKDELISRVSGQYRCSPRTRKQESKLNAGWAGCIQYLEFLTEIQEKPNNVK